LSTRPNLEGFEDTIDIVWSDSSFQRAVWCNVGSAREPSTHVCPQHLWGASLPLILAPLFWSRLGRRIDSIELKDKLGNISKQADRYLRSLFTAGALAVIRYAKIRGTQHRPWLTAPLARRRPTKVAAIALANKLARMAWAMMTRNEGYKEPAALAA
jgi:hypothetical protein